MNTCTSHQYNECIDRFTVQVNFGLPASLSAVNKNNNLSRNGEEVENEVVLSDSDVDKIVGVRDSLELEVTPSFSTYRASVTIVMPMTTIGEITEYFLI